MEKEDLPMTAVLVVKVCVCVCLVWMVSKAREGKYFLERRVED